MIFEARCVISHFIHVNYNLFQFIFVILIISFSRGIYLVGMAYRFQIRILLPVGLSSLLC